MVYPGFYRLLKGESKKRKNWLDFCRTLSSSASSGHLTSRDPTHTPTHTAAMGLLDGAIQPILYACYAVYVLMGIALLTMGV